MITVLAIAAATWGIAMALAPLLQIRAICAHGSSAGVSVGYQQVLLVGFLLWLAYGVALGNAALIVANTVATFTSVATITVHSGSAPADHPSDPRLHRARPTPRIR